MVKPDFFTSGLSYLRKSKIVAFSFMSFSNVIFSFFRGRGVASGVCAGLFYILAFLVSKTWLNLQNLIYLHGCFFLYGIFAGIGILYVFVCLPETEGKTLAEIEKHFAKKNSNKI